MLVLCGNLKKGTEEYDAWMAEHEDNCATNHTGSAGKTEVGSVIEMFQWSWECYKVRYRKYIGDEDLKTLLEKQPYGEDFLVQKKNVSVTSKKEWDRGWEAKKTKNLVEKIN